MLKLFKSNHLGLIAIALLWSFFPFSGYASTHEDVQIIISSATELSISIKPQVLGIDTITNENGDIYFLPRIKDARIVFDKPGKPSRIVRNELITVPSADGFELKEYKIQSYKTISGVIAPFPEMVSKKGVTDNVYRADKSSYENYTTGNPVELNYKGISRTRNLAEISVTVASFDPVTKQIKIPEEITITVNFKPQFNSNTSNISDNYDFPLSLNHNESKQWRVNPKATNNQVLNDSKNADNLQALSSGQWVKIGIENEGLYYIDANLLSTLGLSIPKSDISTIKIFGNGGDELSETVSEASKNVMNEQAIIVNKKSDGTLDNIVFYGSPPNGFHYTNNTFKSYVNHYSKKNYYLLTWGGTAGKRSVAADPPTKPVVNIPQIYTERYCLREELNNPYISGSGRVWFGGTVFPRSFTTALPNLDRMGEVLYRFDVAHRGGAIGTFSITESQNSISTITLSYTTDNEYLNAYEKLQTVTIPASMISGDNRSYLVFNYSNPAPNTATAFFNYFEIQYPRNFIPVNNQIGFFSDPAVKGVTEYNVNGFNSNEILGFDVTNPGTPLLQRNSSSTGGLYILRAELDSTNSIKPRRFFISSNYMQPAVEKTDFADYRSNPANVDVIIITHKDLLGSAQNFAQYRSGRDNLTTAVFRTDLIFNEFGSGVYDPTAIRDFIAFAYNNWTHKPKYVVLWGNGHYDFKNIQTQQLNYVPTYESYDSDSFDARNTYCTDDFFAKIRGNDGLVDIGLGRLPVDSPEEGDWMLEKIKKYENNSSKDGWRTTVTLVADDSPAGNSFNQAEFTNASEVLARNVMERNDPDILQKKIYMVEYPTENIAGGRRKPRATADLISGANNTGTLMVSWIGHGNPRVWAHEEIFDRDKTIPLLKNLDKLFFATTATCDFGRFDLIDIRCGSEMLVVSKIGGAIGGLTTTRPVSVTSSIVNEFYSEVYSRDTQTHFYSRLGDAIYGAKQISNDNDAIKYNLIADPTMRLLIPDYIATIDTINGNAVYPGTTLNIKAHSLATITGRILNPVDSVADATFNGKISVTVMDCDINYDAKDVDNSIHNITKQGGALNRCIAQVINGRFTATLVIPEDISYLKNNGRIQTYAFTNDNRFAKGVDRSIKYSGFDSSLVPETQGPEISIFLDSTTFKPGDYVSKQPVLILSLYDKYGINTTGNGIGHRIEAWFDDNPNSIDLTENYIPSFDVPNSGTAKQLIFDLQPGYHKVKVRVWNVFNLYTISETFFRIADDAAGVIISDVTNYPNPFSSSTIIRFDHNLSEEFNATCYIYSLAGNLVRSLYRDINSVHTSEIAWDGTDESGNSLPTGVYLFRVDIVTPAGITGNKTGIMTLVR